MTEGFDVGLEMSGNPRRFRDMLANMATAARSPCSAFPRSEIAIDWNTVVFNMLTIKGIYGREMYETWYKMTVMLQSRPRHHARSSPTASATATSEGLRRACESGQSGKVDPRLDD